LLALSASGQEKRTARRKPSNTPECARGAICFSGEVKYGELFRRRLTPGLEFLLEQGWTIKIVPARWEKDCTDFVSSVNPPYRAHRPILIDTSYGWTAEDEVSTSPREFVFVTNCTDERLEFDRMAIALGSRPASEKEYEDALDKLGSLAKGSGRLWITDSRITHKEDTPDDKLGKIEWLKFSVEIRLPSARR
jgi:hypothetical protein